MRSSKLFSLVLIIAGLSLSGCVKRTILVETDPPGAQLWINGRLIGKTPASYEFITHGRYKFDLEKSGFQPLTARETVKAPVYQWIPIDFFAEWFYPGKLNDEHRFTYRLTPQPPEERLQPQTAEDLQTALTDLQSGSPDKQIAACTYLAARRDPTTAQPLQEATHSPDPQVRAAALGAYRAVAGKDSTARLLEVLRTDPDREVRWKAAAELEALKDPQALPGLIDSLKNPDPLVRLGAAEALKGMPDPSAVNPLIRALKDKDTGVRRAATEGLGRIGDKTAVPALTKVLFHHDFQTRRLAAKSLAQLKDPFAGPALVKTFTDWDPQVRQTATAALIEFGDERAVPLLIKRLRALKPWTREHAAQALGGIGGPLAVGPLERALARESNSEARAAMQAALEKLK
ncbi:MAG: HEAT repeat domain-containing protein [Candidatus Omnitrophica bacterium]|nr:HEAT repeat domain-containing protein [Candidatus Omnitrophota bacterium]